MVQMGGTPGYDVRATLGHPVNTGPHSGAMPRPFWPRVLRLWGEFWESRNKPERRTSEVWGWRPSHRHFLSHALLQAPVDQVLADHPHSAPTFPVGVNSPRAAGGASCSSLGPSPCLTSGTTLSKCLLEGARRRTSQLPSHPPSPWSPWTEV